MAWVRVHSEFGLKRSSQVCQSGVSDWFVVFVPSRFFRIQSVFIVHLHPAPMPRRPVTQNNCICRERKSSRVAVCCHLAQQVAPIAVFDPLPESNRCGAVGVTHPFPRLVWWLARSNG